MADPASIAAFCKTFLRRHVIGDLGTDPDVVGVRRQRPHDGFVTSNQEIPSQGPMPEIHGVEFEIAPGKRVVVADIVPLESVGVQQQGDTIALEFRYCSDYPPGLVPSVAAPSGARVVGIPDDPRLWMWTVQCVESLIGALGDDAASVRFDVDVVTDTFEALDLAEKVLPLG